MSEKNGDQPFDPLIFWVSCSITVAFVLIYSGGLKVLQTASIVGPLAFIFVKFPLRVSVIRELLAEYRRLEK